MVQEKVRDSQVVVGGISTRAVVQRVGQVAVEVAGKAKAKGEKDNG